MVPHFKYLGVDISNDFRWDRHIDAIAGKGSQKLGMIRRTLHSAPKRVKLMAYLTLCRPVLEYACQAWDPYLAGHIEQLERVQRQAVRFVCSIKGTGSVSEAIETLGLDRLEDRRRKARLRLMHQILEDSKQSDLQGFLISSVQDNNGHNTRSKTRGYPIALTAHYDFLHNSFLHRTSRDLRLAS